MPETLNKINLELDKPQKGKIKVHTQIINDLSSGIYSSPASCVKELVNNSYDADAKKVIIRVKPVSDSITIIDDGKGMNAEDFDNKFAWISHSTKRAEAQVSEILKRPLIGKIGIGFIAVNEICHELEIISSKNGEEFKFTANINFKKYFEDAADSNGDEDEGIIKGEYDLVNEFEEKDANYTIIRLLGLKDSVRSILDDKQYLSEILKKRNRTYDKYFFDSMKDLMNYHFKNDLRSFTEDNAYVQFIIDLSSYIPVEYIETGPIENCDDTIIEEIKEMHKKLDFKVDLDGIFLKKPIYFPEQKYRQEFVSFKELIKVNEDEDEDEKDPEEIEIEGYFYIQHKILFPRELNGVAIRIKNIPIAEQFGFDDSFMRYPSYTNQLFKNWVSGEIYVKKGLEDAMNIDRKSFRVTHPHYLALQNFLHEYLSEVVFKIALDIYEGGKSVREKAKEKRKREQGKKILNTNKITFKPSKPKPPKKTTKKDSTSIEEAKIDFAPVKIIQTSSKTSTVEINERIAKKFKKRDWEYLESIFLIFESAFNEADGDTEKLRALFYEKIKDWKEIK